MNPHRTVLSLDGTWDFWLDEERRMQPDGLPAWPQYRLQTPMAWQPQAERLRDTLGVGWYRRSISVPAEWLEDRLELRFGAVDYRATVWLNGTLLGSHEGGYLPFRFDLSPAVKAGANELVVRVEDLPEEMDYLPHGKQSWYGTMSGIWQSVTLTRTAKFALQDLKLTPDAQHSVIEARVSFTQPAGEGAVVELFLRRLGESGVRNMPMRLRVDPGALETSCSLAVPHPVRWSLEHPALYQVEARLIVEDQLADALSRRTGLRTFESRNGALFLNGERIYLRGALDQDYYLETFYTTPSRAVIEDEFRKAKALGLNCLRIHIKIPDPVYYDVADELGILIWSEMPNWNTLSPETVQRAKETWLGVLDRDGHHPSIVIWTLINENWGTDLVSNPTHRAWLKEMYAWLKEQDPARLVVDNSACEPNFHLQSDLNDFHYYKVIPDHTEEWREFVDRFASDPASTYSPYGDAKRGGSEPLILSEFGVWGLPDETNLLSLQGDHPWWFDTGLGNGGVTYPRGVRERYCKLGLERIFGSWEAFIAATQWQQFLGMKKEIEIMRTRSEIQGYVITEFTDVHWESNGLLDMGRNPKAYYYAFSAINTDRVVVGEALRGSYRGGETLRVKTWLSNGGDGDVTPGRLAWRIDELGLKGEMAVDGAASGATLSAGELSIALPEIVQPLRAGLQLEWLAGSGAQVARNTLLVSLYPERKQPVALARTLAAVDADWAEKLAGLGYALAPVESADCLLATRLTPELRERLEAGATVALLPESEDALPQSVLGARLQARAGNITSGDWASSFGWVKRSGAYQRLPMPVEGILTGALVDDSLMNVIPELNLVNLPFWGFQAGVQAGMFVGWIHSPCAWIYSHRCGAGQLVVCTFRLKGADPQTDPAAVELLDALLQSL